MFTAIFLLTAISALISIAFWSLRTGITPMPSSPKAKRAFLKALPPSISGEVYDLGAGWGTLLMPLAHLYPYAKTVGFETSFIPYYFTHCRIAFKGLKNVHLIRQDFFNVSLEEAGLIVCYLYPGAMHRLKPKFEAELKPGTWIMSNTFAIPGWHPLYTVEVGDLYKTKIFVYRIEEKRK